MPKETALSADRPPNRLTLAGPNGRQVMIDLQTGEVDLCGLEPSEAARLFWEAVTRHARKGTA